MNNEIRTGSRDWVMANAWRMRGYRGPTTTVPGGHKVEARDEYGEFVGLRPPGADLDGIVDKIKDFLKHPSPKCAYVWRDRKAHDTERMVELQMIRAVKWSELKPNSATLSLYAFQEVGVPDAATGHRTTETYVGWKKSALYEVTPEWTYEWFIHPGRYHQSLVTELPESINNEFQEAGIGTAKMEAIDPRTQAQEVARDARRGK